MNDGVLALPVHDFPLTLVDVEPGVLMILEKLFPSFTDKALGMHGVPNVGKTPLGRTIAMAMSRYWIRKLKSNHIPGFREASEFDFFRGEAGRPERPDIFDDGSLPEQPMRKLKGFCDVGNTVLTKERWGAAKFPQGQPRLYISNDVDLSAEPSGRSMVITHIQFMQMLEPAWMKGSCLSDIKAVLKRTCIIIIIITDNFIYYRPATEAEVCVECIKLNDAKSLLRRSGGVKYMAYRKGNRDLSEDHHKHLQWEEAWMRSIMDNKGENKPPMPTETSITSPFSCKTTVSIQVHLEESGPAPAIKRESSFFRQTLRDGIPGACIDLDMSPPKKARKVPESLPAIKEETHATATRPMNYGLIDLVSEDEDEPPTNPPLEIAGMEMIENEEDVFNHGYGVDGGDSS